MKLAIDFVLIVGILLSALALIGLFRVKQKRIPQYILIVFWCFILGIILFFYARLHQLRFLAYLTNYIEDGARFFIPPLIYIYIKSVFLKKFDLLRKNLVHFIPFIVFFVLYTIPKSLRLDFPVVQFIDQYVELALVMDIYGIVYFIFSLRLFYFVSKTMKHSYSYVSNRDFLWLEKFLVSFLIVLVVDLVVTISEISFGYDIFWDGYITIFFMIVAMIYIGYFGLTQSTIFLPEFLVHNHFARPSESSLRKSHLNEIEKAGLLKRFNELMYEEKLFLRPKLNLKILAEEMKVPERTLSAFFSEALNGTFYDIINDLRVEEVKKRLKTDNVKNYSITGIGLSSGFSSKSSFFRVFKNKTKLSPSAFRENVIKESHEQQ